MTAAVCLRCGRMKVGAFTACPGCHFMPERPEDLAKSVLLSDQAASPSALANASAQLQAGRAVAFDPKDVAIWVAAIRSGSPQLRMHRGCAVVWYASLVILVVLVIVLLATLIYLN